MTEEEKNCDKNSLRICSAKSPQETRTDWRFIGINIIIYIKEVQKLQRRDKFHGNTAEIYLFVFVF